MRRRFSKVYSYLLVGFRNVELVLFFYIVVFGNGNLILEEGEEIFFLFCLWGLDGVGVFYLDLIKVLYFFYFGIGGFFILGY